MKRRMFKSNMKWALWRWSEVVTGDLARLYLVKTPWGAIAIHWVLGNSQVPWRHDHPASMLTYIWRGWYAEERLVDRFSTGFHPNPYRLVDKKNRITAALWDTHRIVDVAPGGCVTLVFEGPKIREWGFHTPAGWVHWKEFYDKQTTQ